MKIKLKKIMPFLKGLNNTIYELYVVDEHCIKDIDKKYYKYKVYEIFKKDEAKNSVFISIYKDKNKLKKQKEGKKEVYVYGYNK